eukprot:10969066-Karenia_brevis.AAC.1
MKRDTHAKERIVAFIPAYAAYLYSRLHRRDDGEVAYERVKGEKPSVVGLEFGEKRKSNEFLIADEEGIRKSRFIRRSAKEETWSDDNLTL